MLNEQIFIFSKKGQIVDTPPGGSKVEVTLITDLREWSKISAEFFAEVNTHRVLGFDAEWVTDKASGIVRKTALIQLATHRGWVVLFRLNRLGSIPKDLIPVLEDETVLKLGVGVSKDAKKLKKDYGVEMMGSRSLDALAARLRPGKPPVGLSALASEFLGVKMDKSKEVSSLVAFLETLNSQ